MGDGVTIWRVGTMGKRRGGGGGWSCLYVKREVREVSQSRREEGRLAEGSQRIGEWGRHSTSQERKSAEKLLS